MFRAQRVIFCNQNQQDYNRSNGKIRGTQKFGASTTHFVITEFPSEVFPTSGPNIGCVLWNIDQIIFYLSLTIWKSILSVDMSLEITVYLHVLTNVNIQTNMKTSKTLLNGSKLWATMLPRYNWQLFYSWHVDRRSLLPVTEGLFRLAQVKAMNKFLTQVPLFCLRQLLFVCVVLFIEVISKIKNSSKT